MSLDQPSGFVKHQKVTRDAFLGGRLTLAQPVDGFRAGMDSVLLGAAVSHESASVLDLGAGVGTAGLVALAHNPARVAVLVESDPGMAELARANVLENGFAATAEVQELDVTAGGLPQDRFTSVIANPPYFARGRGTPAARRGAVARHMQAGAIELWVKAATGAAMARTEVIVINPADGLAEVLAAFSLHLGAITVLPLSARPGIPASRVLVRGIKGSRAPMRLLAGRSLHGPTGNGFAPEFDDILRGVKVLDW